MRHYLAALTFVLSLLGFTALERFFSHVQTGAMQRRWLDADTHA